jgi:hypothetical protein
VVLQYLSIADINCEVDINWICTGVVDLPTDLMG